MRYSNFRSNNDDDEEESDGGEERPNGVEAFFEDIDETQKQMMIAEAELGKLEWEKDVLDKAIRIAEKSLFWRVSSISRKLEKIGEIYESLRIMLLDEGEEEENASL